ncbi:hypothetical protein ACW7BJ_33625 [Azospirillum argentinense]
MLVYQTDRDGYYVGATEADESPLEPGIFLIPAGCVEEEPPAVADGGRARWMDAGWIVEAPPEPEPEPEPEPASLDAIKAEAARAIDLQAGAARAAFAAPGQFQAEEYQQAATQAERCVAADPGPFPALEADVAAGTLDPRLGRPVADVWEAADLVLFTRSLWYDALNAIRVVRLTAKAAVQTAETPAAVATVLDGLAWPSPDTLSPSLDPAGTAGL